MNPAVPRRWGVIAHCGERGKFGSHGSAPRTVSDARRTADPAHAHLCSRWSGDERLDLRAPHDKDFGTPPHAYIWRRRQTGAENLTSQLNIYKGCCILLARTFMFVETALLTPPGSVE